MSRLLQRVSWIQWSLVLMWMNSLVWNCSQNPGIATTIGVAGGKVTSSDGKLSLEIPALALTTPTNITLTPKTGVLEDNALLAYVMQPDGLTFALPVTVRLRLKTSDIPGISPDQGISSLALFSKNATGREELQHVVTTFQQKEDTWEISAFLSHFSDLQIALGFFSFVAEGISSLGLELQVGELRELKLSIFHRSQLGQQITQIVAITSLQLKDGVPEVAKILGAKERGQNFKEPYHRQFGNGFKLARENKEFRFYANPSPVIECMKAGDAFFTAAIEARQEYLYNGKLLEQLSPWLKATLFLKVKCIPSPVSVPEVSDKTVSAVRHLKRRGNGDIAVVGKQGVALHDGKTLKRKKVIHLGDGLLDESEIDDEESVGLEPNPTPSPPTAGKIVPEIHKADGSKKPLVLPKTAQDSSFKEIKPVCPPDKNQPCRSKEVSLLDANGLLHLLRITPNASQNELISFQFPQLPKLETAEIRKTTTGYEGIGIAQDTGDIHFFITQELTQITVGTLGAAKVGKHLLRCNTSLDLCTVGNLNVGELWVLRQEPNTTPRSWKAIFQERLADSFVALDLLEKISGELILLMTHAQTGRLTQIALDSVGKKQGTRNIQTECNTLHSALLEPSGNEYIAACEINQVGVLLRRDFSDRVPQEPVQPPQEPTTQDAGPADQNTTTEPSSTPDPTIDCSPYRFTGTDRKYPSWYAGTIDNPICSAMYDKLYGRNGQNIECKIDADCKNPCRYLCCGNALRLELIVCKEGMCRAEISSKCNFCDGVSTNFNGCGLPAEYQP